MTTQRDDSHPLLRQTRDNWVDEAIRDAQKRGDFDGLPGVGKPLDLSSNPHGSDWEMGHRVLKNAGFAPEWIELDKAIRAETAALTVLRDKTASYLRAYGTPPPPDTPDTIEERAPAERRLQRVLRRMRSDDARHQTRRDNNRQWLDTERQRARSEYLQRSADLDRKIAEFNAALPKELWWKARRRLTPEQAAVDFDRSCPPDANAL